MKNNKSQTQSQKPSPVTTGELVAISQAAKYLDVSIDTIRRWDRLGMLHSTRPTGKTRFFYMAELRKVKISGPIVLEKQKTNLSSPSNFRQEIRRISLILIKIIILLVTIMTISFLLFPEKTARFLVSFL